MDAGGNVGVDESDGGLHLATFQEGDGAGGGGVTSPLPTTKEDFHLPGTQPGMAEPILDPDVGGECSACHAVDPILPMWQGTMMANASRDPLFWACLAIAEQDAPGSGDLCQRCHIPKAWLDGRSDPTDGSAVLPGDMTGVSCNFCHRMVDPIFVESPGAPDLGSPAEDAFILGRLASLGLQPADLNGPKIRNGMYVIAPENDRNVSGMRGPRRCPRLGRRLAPVRAHDIPPEPRVLRRRDRCVQEPSHARGLHVLVEQRHGRLWRCDRPPGEPGESVRQLRFLQKHSH